MRDYKGISVEVGEDGRKVVTLTQSWLGTYTECPEKARRELDGTLPRHEYDFFATGTSAHAAFEYVLDSIRDDDIVPPIEDAIEVAMMTWAELLPEVGWNKYTPETAPEFIASTIRTWYREVLPKLGEPLVCELRFNELFHEDDRRVIRLQGSIDHVNANVQDVGAALVDWKTASAGWRDTWKLKRHGIQPTVYTWAWYRHIEERALLPFHYFVVLGDGTVQQLTVERDQRHWDWLKQRCIQIADLIDAGLSSWPMNDYAKDAWGCSPKFCAAWDTCRGKFLGNTPW